MVDIVDMSFDLFKRFNIKNSEDGSDEVLDADEIKKAKLAGFNLFELKENMTEEEFLDACFECAAIDNKMNITKEFEQKTKDIHIKYLQIQHNSKKEIKENETLQHYERRLQIDDILKTLCEEDRQLFNNALNNHDSYNIVNKAINHFENKEEHDALNPLLDELYDFCSNNIQNDIEFFEEKLSSNEYDLIRNIMSGNILNNPHPEQSLNNAMEIVQKYSNQYPDQKQRFEFVSAKIDELKNFIQMNK